MEFEPTRSFTYRFSRYVILPELQQLPETQSGDRFLLRELAWPLIDKHLTQEQQSIRLKKANSDGEDTIGQCIRFYIPFLVKNLNAFISLGKGYFCAQTDEDISDEDLNDAAIEDGDEGANDLKGYIYAFSFPSIVKNGVFPIKIGKTTGDVNSRVLDQCKGSAIFEQPVVLGSWPAPRVGPTELAIHNILKARGLRKDDAPGREWFNTTISDIQTIIDFVVE